MTRNRRILIPLIIFITYANGCSLFSGNTRIDEVVFASTEVGTPEGDKVTKEIGPAGGSLASPDGRLTLTVPQNALTETLSFSIQPITNKFGGGIGLAYRLEPSGKTFSTPFQVSVHYNDHDLEGTISEGLSLAYQDGQGAWHLQKSSRLDKEKKTLTVSTIHFSDWSFLTRLKLSPSKTSLHVGETLFIGLFLCEEPVLLDKILSRPAKCSSLASQSEWRLEGEGSLGHGEDVGIPYTAPLKVPRPNVAKVIFSYELEQWGETSMEIVKGKMFSTITIVGQGYRVSGPADVGGGSVFTGDICDLEAPFSIGSTNVFIASFDLVPSSPNEGTWKIGYGSGITGGRGGEYKVEGSDTVKTGITCYGDGTATIKGAGTGTGGPAFHLVLTPLNGNESSCEK